MNVDKFNSWLTLLANVGVLAGIVFLALEIKQNTQMLERQAHLERSGNISGLLVEPGSALPGIYAKVKAVDGAMEPVTQAIMDTYDLEVREAVV